MDPIFIDSAEGTRIKDIDGNVYLDYICSWGPLILGHSNPVLLEGIEDIFKKEPLMVFRVQLKLIWPKQLSKHTLR